MNDQYLPRDIDLLEFSYSKKKKKKKYKMNEEHLKLKNLKLYINYRLGFRSSSTFGIPQKLFNKSINNIQTLI